MLPGRRRGEILVFDEVDSTNNVLKHLAIEGAAPGTAVIALKQTAGKGRLGRSFISPEDEGIYLSYLLRPLCSPEKAAELTSWVSVAVCSALKSACGISPEIKWVNDILLNRMKLGGILCEMSVGGSPDKPEYVVAGIGINVLQKSFSPELEKKATSLLIETRKRFSFDAIIAGLIAELDRLSDDFPDNKEQYLEEYRRLCSTVGSTVAFENRQSGENGLGGDDGYRTAFAEGIADDFSLAVRDENGNQSFIRTGEVSVRGLYGYV